MKKSDIYIILIIMIILVLLIGLASEINSRYNKNNSTFIEKVYQLENIYFQKELFLKLQKNYITQDKENLGKLMKRIEKKKLPDIVLYEKLKAKIIKNEDITKEINEYIKLYDNRTKILKTEISNLRQQMNHYKKNSLLIKNFLLWGLIFFSLYLFYLIKFKLLKDISTINKVVTKIANKEINIEDERFYTIQQKQYPYSHIVGKLNDILNSFNKFLIPLSKASSELSNIFINVQESTKYQSSVINEEAASLNQVASSTEEMSITAKEIADVAKDIENSSSKGKEMAQIGAKLIEEVSTLALNVKTGILDTANKNMSIVDKSKDIDKILEIMTDITGEIHLLALNASIESVGAGEYGERFGVIAQEIRELADNSKQVIEKIKTNIESFHHLLNSAVLSIDYNVKQVEQSLEKAKETGEYFGKIFKMIDESANYSKHIANATMQQKIASEQIVDVMREVTDVINSSANEITKINNSMDKIMEVSLTINSLIQTFKTAKKNNLRNIVEDISNNKDVIHLNPKNIRQLFKEKLSENHFFEALYVYDIKNNFLIYEYDKTYKIDENKISNFDVSEREWYKRVIEGEKFVLTSPYISVISNELCITFSAPVKKGNKIVGVVGLDINYRKWIEKNRNEL